MVRCLREWSRRAIFEGPCDNRRKKKRRADGYRHNKREHASGYHGDYKKQDGGGYDGNRVYDSKEDRASQCGVENGTSPEVSALRVTLRMPREQGSAAASMKALCVTAPCGDSQR